MFLVGVKDHKSQYQILNVQPVQDLHPISLLVVKHLFEILININTVIGYRNEYQ